MAYTIATLNVNGLRDAQKRDMVFEYLSRRKADIVFLQETHSEKKDEDLWRKQWGGKIIFSHGKNNSKGVAILTSRKSGLNIINSQSDSQGRWVKGDINVGGNTVSFISIYAPNIASTRKQFLVEFGNALSGMQNCNDCIIAGDLNCQLDSKNYDPSIASLSDIIQANDLLDSWAHISNKPGYTYYHKGIKRPSRIDYVLISQTLGNQLQEVSVDSSGLSDHSTIFVRLNNQSVPTGKGRWICNNEILKDEQCRDRVEWFWNYWTTQKDVYDSLFVWWDIGKSRLKEIIKDYEIEKRFKEKREEQRLQKQYDFVINNHPGDNSVELSEIEKKLKLHETQKWEKAKLRLHTIQKVEGEKPSKYFLSAEKQQHKNNLIKYLENTDGQTLNEPTEMLKYVQTFYEQLFSSNGINNFHMQKILNTVSTFKFEKDLIQEVERDIDDGELYQALKDMNKDKAPGIDGLTVEFYLTFWNLIKNDFVELIDYCHVSGLLPDSMNKALVRLLFKNRGERCHLGNWRPISLLNVDYKIISKVLTKRLGKLMPDLINEDQTSGVQGRNIQDNLMILRDTVDFINMYNKKGAIICVDQEKAFDRIEWRYLHAMMDKMGIPSGLKHWIKILYSNPLVVINVNNFLTEPFSATRGIRQGCPLSPLLYSICVEGLANLIRSSNCIKGVNLPGQEVTFKVVQHADDTTIFVTDNKEFTMLEKIFYTYSEGSGSKINVQKTQGLWLGAWKNRQDTPGNFKWTNEKIKILGIYFGNEVRPEDNWAERLNRMKSVLNRWKERSLTLKGKSVVVNSLIGGSLAYCGSVLSCPDDLIKKMNDVIMDFYWSGKPDKIKRDTIRGPSNLGGTGLINIECKLQALKLKWLNKYTQVQGKWKYLFDFWIEKANREENLGWFVFCNPSSFSSRTTSFYRSLLQAFVKTGGKIELDLTCINEALVIPLWNNTVITGSKKILNSKILQPCGMVLLKHVLKNGMLLSVSELAQRCNIRPINAGKIMAGLRNHIDKTFIKETREGPANHVSNWLAFETEDQEMVPVHDLSVKSVYNSLVKKAFIPPKAENVWPSRLNIRQDCLDWKEIWKKANSKAIDHEDKDLWFRLRHRILPTKDTLSRMKMVNDRLCGLCLQEDETIEHLFIYCRITWKSWTFLENVLRKHTGEKNFYLNDSNRILGYGKDIDGFSLFMIGKLNRTIWVTRCHNLTQKEPVKDTELLSTYKRNIKRIVLLEQKRLHKMDFMANFTKNNALCQLIGDKCIFNI